MSLRKAIEQVKQNIEEDRMAGKYKKGQMIVQGQWPNPDKWAKEYIIPNADEKGVRIYAKGTSFKIEKLQEIVVRDFFELRKQINEDQFGTFFIKFEGIKNPKKVDTAFERATQYTFSALMEDADIEMEGEGEFVGKDILKIDADKSEMKNINKFLNARNRLAKQTQEMIKKAPIAPKDRGNPKATTGADRISDSNIRKLYQKRADHFYVTALLMKLANPNTVPKYSIQKFMKEN